MWLLIDDSKDLNCDITAKTPKAGKEILKRLKGQIEVLCIDHDLGFNQETGYDIIEWALDNNFLPDKIQIVSLNPVGAKRIADLLKAANYMTKDNINFGRHIIF